MDRRTSVAVVAVAATGAITCIIFRKLKPLTRFIQFLDPIQPAASTEGDDDDANPPALIPLDEIEQYIAEKPNTTIPGAEQKIVWYNDRKEERTRVSVVFLHGWSACRQELSPVPQNIAASLHANLYLGRLPGHGRRQELMDGGGPVGNSLASEATPQELFLYATRALYIGQSLGEQVILVGMSTGACLATWLAAKLVKEKKSEKILAGMVLISPAYALAHPLYPVLKNVFATLRVLMPAIRWRLIEIVLGEQDRCIKARNEQHARYASLNYPVRALLNLLDVLWEVETYLQEDKSLLLDVPTIMIGNPQDPTVNFRSVATNYFLQKWGDVPKALYCISRTEHPHVLGSQMLSPSTVDEVSHAASAFLQANTDAVEVHLTRKVKKQRSQSMSSGLGQYARYPSFSDLTAPLLS